METYFQNDPRISEWVDQITEKIFMVCLLNGVDSETEFEKGCQILLKVASSIHGIKELPTDYIKDGLKQILEQQLPDSRVINNFPEFHDTMNRMICESLLKTVNNSFEAPLISDVENEQSEQKQTIERAVAAMAAIEFPYPAFQPDIIKLEAETIQSETQKTSVIKLKEKSTTLKNEHTKNTFLFRKAGSERKRHEEEQMHHLKQVLEILLPNGQINWGLNLMGHSFLAQIEDILIGVNNPEHPYPTKDLCKEGWKIYQCELEDLNFPRRLERSLRQIIRSRKYQIKN